MKKALAQFIFRIIGWKLVGNYPRHLDKKMVIVAPHTSNWDFPIGIIVRAIMQDDIRFVGKDSLFKPPLGWIMYWLGGIPIDRSKSNNFVQSVVNEYQKRKRLAIQIAPEGTRKQVGRFKTGYYYIAKEARIPIVPVVFDWKNKEVVILENYTPTDDSEGDLKKIEDMFRKYVGKNPDQGLSPVDSSR